VNDRDVERLVSRLERPSPSPQLDARIAAITGRVQPERKRSPFRNVVPVGSAVACAALLGFVLGRQSVATPPQQSSVPENKTRISAAAGQEPEVRAFVPASEAFVRLMTKPQTEVSVFGGQSLVKQVSPSEIQ